jgi:hypothetical protein
VSTSPPLLDLRLLPTAGVAVLIGEALVDAPLLPFRVAEFLHRRNLKVADHQKEPEELDEHKWPPQPTNRGQPRLGRIAKA